MNDSGANDLLQPLLNELVTDSSVSSYVQNLINQRPVLVRFRPDLELCFQAKRTQEFSLIFRIASALWLLLYVVVLSVTHQNFPFLFGDDGYLIWQSTFLFAGAVTGGLAVCAYLPRTHAFIHHYLIAPVTTLLLFQVMVGGLAYPDGYYNIHASYNMIILMVLALFSLRVLWQKGALMLLCSGLMAGATMFINGWHAPSLQILHAYVLMSTVLLSIAFFVERRERLGFLHEVLVAVKSHQLEKINAHLGTIAREDALCGLANRRAFDDSLDTEWDRARREEQPLSLLFIDIDHFKLYNDSYGHAAGDDCLRQVGLAMKKALLRPADLLARYGGEEFVVLLPCTDALGAEEVADRVLRAIDSLAIPHKRSLVAFHVTASIGICTLLPGDGNTLAQLVENADAALYKAKTAGRHCFRHYQEPPGSLRLNFHDR